MLTAYELLANHDDRQLDGQLKQTAAGTALFLSEWSELGKKVKVSFGWKAGSKSIWDQIQSIESSKRQKGWPP